MVIKFDEYSHAGRYISGTLVSSSSEAILMTYPRAGYICGFSLSYFLGSGASLVVRSNPSRREVWSSLDEATPTSTESWETVNLTRAQYYLTSQFDETLEIVLIASGDRNSSLVIAGAVDNVNVQFCLPCNFEHLQLNVTQFVLNYKNQTRIYLRQPQNLTIQVSAC